MCLHDYLPTNLETRNMLTIDSHEIGIPPRILTRIQSGEAVFIEHEHLPLAILLPGSHLPGPRPVGLCKGEFVVPDDFNEPLEVWDSLEEDTLP